MLNIPNKFIRDELRFPFLFGGTFIEGFKGVRKLDIRGKISLPFRRDFH